MSYPEVDFLYLSEPDVIAAGGLDMPGCIATMEEMFKLLSVGDYRMAGKNANSHGAMVRFPEQPTFPGMPVDGTDRRFMAMPAYVGGAFQMAGVKWYGSNIANKKEGLPRSILMLTLNDKDTGAPVAYMSANLISSYRTGAVPAVGVKHLATQDAHVLGIVGPGVMNKTTLKSILAVRPGIDTVKIKGRGQRSIDSYIAYVKQNFPQIQNIAVVDTLEEAVRGSDIVSVATNGVGGIETYPYIEESWIKKGAVLCMPSDGNFSEEFLASDRCKLVVDNSGLYDAWEAELAHPAHAGVGIVGVKWMDMIADGKMPRERLIDLGDILTGKNPGRQSDDEIFIYSIGGMPVEDVAWGTKLYRNAMKKGIGTKLLLWDQPALA